MVFVSPLASTSVSHFLSIPAAAVAVCGRSPTLLKVTGVPAFTRVRLGAKPNSLLFAPIWTLLTPSAIGPSGPATVAGGGGGHSGWTLPFSANVHTASPVALP